MRQILHPNTENAIKTYTKITLWDKMQRYNTHTRKILVAGIVQHILYSIELYLSLSFVVILKAVIFEEVVVFFWLNRG